jgi:tetratricopeptide (TPR) repeat protein
MSRAGIPRLNPVFTVALQIVEKAFGNEDPKVAIALNNLAFLYDAQGRYAEAEPMFKRAQTIVETVLGPGHPSLATSLENFTALMRKTGRKAEAIEMEARARAIRAKHAIPNL